jgi:Domain of unknown function (DUF5679)
MDAVEAKPLSMYCIKCRTHTENVDQREDCVTSKGKPRAVTKATCAVCSKKKNKFSKTVEVKPSIDDVEKKITTKKVDTKKLEKLLNQYIDSLEVQ